MFVLENTTTLLFPWSYCLAYSYGVALPSLMLAHVYSVYLHNNYYRH